MCCQHIKHCENRHTHTYTHPYKQAQLTSSENMLYVVMSNMAGNTTQRFSYKAAGLNLCIGSLVVVECK